MQLKQIFVPSYFVRALLDYVLNLCSIQLSNSMKTFQWQKKIIDDFFKKDELFMISMYNNRTINEKVIKDNRNCSKNYTWYKPK